MHLKPYLKLQKKERSPEISQDSLRGPPGSRQRAAPEEKYSNDRTFPKPSLLAPSRKLLGVLYPNNMCNMSGKCPADGPSAREKKNATIHQGEEGEGPLDVWAVVKPGNTKEKIAFFAAQQCSGSNRLGSMKIKSTWDIDGRTAKRRKKSLDLKKAKIQLERVREAGARCAPPEPFACGIEHCSVHNDGAEGAFPGRSLSVIEMVAFLEQRASALLVDCAKTCAPAPSVRPKGALPGSDAFPSAGGCEVHERGVCGEQQQQGEPVRVLDMVARLESECLRRQSEREAGGLSRNNSFRRNVGRVLLASGTQPWWRAGAMPTGGGSFPNPCRPPPGCPRMPRRARAVSVHRRRPGLSRSRARGLPGRSPCASASRSPRPRRAAGRRSSLAPAEDQLPGRLFFLQPSQPAPHEQQPLRESPREKAGEASRNEDEDALGSDRAYIKTHLSPEPPALSAPQPEGALQALEASCLKRQVSHDFLETRFKIQQLLEPQQYMAFLLVALKCTCYYFKFLIEYYNIRPDPCKQCKKKYVKGDVSLCRWHPKPYCQALPYGPGYWMCCHRSQKGIPGCKLGLHDNHWVPACHSFNRALHKKSRGAGGEGEEEY
uniref:F-box protein 34 n=1 Tax=Anas platyrhynchos TaxID=8839 RepID=A0A8B9R0E4_ANAPL